MSGVSFLCSSVLLCVLRVKPLPCLRKAKPLTQRTQRNTEKTGDAWANFGILDETLGWEDRPLSLVLQCRAWYIGKGKNCEDEDPWLTQSH
jgi:hypothetical protein